ncbi:MAG: hypothetical protein CL575_00095 [Altererythrobacter sp.]|nr:hypothetical protein [Altererythrobacter sp.]MBK61355.1 hypothetical protein [Altererythrobacter sp.]
MCDRLSGYVIASASELFPFAICKTHFALLRERADYPFRAASNEVRMITISDLLWLFFFFCSGFLSDSDTTRQHKCHSHSCKLNLF